jgi:hypothetical protein
MKPLALTLAALLMSSLPALAHQSEVERLKAEVEKLKADNAALKVELETKSKFEQAAVELEKKQVEMAREKKFIEEKFKGAAAKATAEEHYRLAEVLFQKRETERALQECAKALQADPGCLPARALRTELQFLQKAELEKKDIEMARKNKIWGATFTELEAKVTATANEIGLVVLSIGSRLGIAEGDEFTITRKGEFVAKVRVDRVDAQWCAGKVVQKTGDPAVGDDAIRKDPRNAQAPPSLKRPAADEVQSIRKELDEIRNQVRQLSDRLLPAWQDHGVSTAGLTEELLFHLKIRQGVLIREVREGSPAAKLGLKSLDIVPDLGEAEVLRILKEGGALTVYRQGTLVTIPVDLRR